MKEMFLKSMVVCAAIGTFGGGAYVIGSGISSVVESKIASYLQNVDVASGSTAANAAADTVDNAGALVQSIKKLGKSLQGVK